MACDPAQEWYNGQPALETHFGIAEAHKPRWALMDTEWGLGLFTLGTWMPGVLQQISWELTWMPPFEFWSWRVCFQESITVDPIKQTVSHRKLDSCGMQSWVRSDALSPSPPLAVLKSVVEIRLQMPSLTIQDLMFRQKFRAFFESQTSRALGQMPNTFHLSS